MTARLSPSQAKHIKGTGKTAAFVPLTEKQIHEATIDAWRQHGVPGTVVATIPNMRAWGQAGLTKGLPDLLVISEGKARFIELKRLGGTVSPEQAMFKHMCEAQGIACEITYGRDEPIRLLKAWGALRGRVECVGKGGL